MNHGQYDLGFCFFTKTQCASTLTIGEREMSWVQWMRLSECSIKTLWMVESMVHQYSYIHVMNNTPVNSEKITEKYMSKKGTVIEHPFEFN